MASSQELNAFIAKRDDLIKRIGDLQSLRDKVFNSMSLCLSGGAPVSSLDYSPSKAIKDAICQEISQKIDKLTADLNRLEMSVTFKT